MRDYLIIIDREITDPSWTISWALPVDLIAWTSVWRLVCISDHCSTSIILILVGILMFIMHIDNLGWEIGLLARKVSGHLLVLVLSAYNIPNSWNYDVAVLSLNFAKVVNAINWFHWMRACLIHLARRIVNKRRWTSSMHEHSVVASAFMTLHVWTTSWILASLVLPHKVLLVILRDSTLEVASQYLRPHIEHAESFRVVIVHYCRFFLFFLLLLVTIRRDCRSALLNRGSAELRLLVVL